jgi:hypothetical protein
LTTPTTGQQKSESKRHGEAAPPRGPLRSFCVGAATTTAPGDARAASAPSPPKPLATRPASRSGSHRHREFRVHENHSTNSRPHRLPALAPALGWRELAAYLPFEVGDEGGRAEWPAGSDVFAQHVALPARRAVVEETAPTGDQVVERARLDERVIGDAEMRAGAGPGPVPGLGHQSRPVQVAFDVVPWPRVPAARPWRRSPSALARDCRATPPPSVRVVAAG